MFSKSFAAMVLVALVEGRFGQEHPAAISEIADVTSGGQPGQAASIAGGAISNLLAAANPCTKFQTGDNIIASLGSGADALKAAQDFVAAEQNFNPFAQDIPALCSDPTLPTTEALRGIVPLVDPAVGGAALANQLSAKSLKTPFNAVGLSVAQVFAANGFSNFTTKSLAGTAGAAPAAAAAGNATVAVGTAETKQTVVAQAPAVTPAATDNEDEDEDEDEAVCFDEQAAPTTLATVIASSTAAASAPFTNSSTMAAPAAGVDFGLCVPTMKFKGGLDGRAATEFTFQAIDSKISAIQEEALNPNIITNRICDELTNQCQSNQAAKDLCASVKAQILALGTRDVATANAWNSGLGFAGANTDPDGPAA